MATLSGEAKSVNEMIILIKMVSVVARHFALSREPEVEMGHKCR
jgi:hypothetical protein